LGSPFSPRTGYSPSSQPSGPVQLCRSRHEPGWPRIACTRCLGCLRARQRLPGVCWLGIGDLSGIVARRRMWFPGLTSPAGAKLGLGAAACFISWGKCTPKSEARKNVGIPSLHPSPPCQKAASSGKGSWRSLRQGERIHLANVSQN
jgi:hypothetical protein